jgi:threonylcarbamoyladenosine tRNA methylthiotransferase MtaB
VKEIVLTGVNIGDFGLHDADRTETFFELIQQLDKVDGIQRFRISSIEPNLLKDEIIEFVANSNRFMPHFHIPLQSGSDEILGLMKRRYRSQHYRNRVEKIKSLIPHCCIGVDVIVGFPGEDENEFLTTYNFLNELDISYIHVFTYSERDNTEAVHLGNIVSKEIRHQRNKMLRILSEKKQRAFYNSHAGDIRKVLFELPHAGMTGGFTDNYIKVELTDPEIHRGMIAQVFLKEGIEGVMTGEILQQYVNSESVI